MAKVKAFVADGQMNEFLCPHAFPKAEDNKCSSALPTPNFLAIFLILKFLRHSRLEY